MEIRIILSGVHAELYERLLALTANAPGPKFDRHTLAESLIRAILDDDARDNSDAGKLN